MKFYKYFNYILSHHESTKSMQTPLHIAIMRNKVEIIRLLLSHQKIDKNVTNDIFKFFRKIKFHLYLNGLYTNN